MTRDGEIVVSHDDDLARMCGRPGIIRELDYADLATFDGGARFSLDDGAGFPFRGRDLKIPRLAEVFAEFPKLRVLVEVKQVSPSLIAPMLELIDRGAMRSSVLVASEHQQPLDEVRKLAPDLPTNFSCLEAGGFFQALATRDATYQPPGAALQIPRQYESWQLVTPESVEFAHQIGVEVHVWTVNEEAEMAELLEMGVDGLISDYPGRLLDLIRKRKKASR